MHLGDSGSCLLKAFVDVEAVAETEDSEDRGGTDASISGLGTHVHSLVRIDSTNAKPEQVCLSACMGALVQHPPVDVAWRLRARSVTVVCFMMTEDRFLINHVLCHLADQVRPTPSVLLTDWANIL